MRWNRAVTILATAVGLFTGGLLCEGVQGQTLRWAKDHTTTTQGGVNVAVSHTHGYTYGTFVSTSGAVLKLYQYDLGDGTERSSVAFPSFPGSYEAVCVTSYHHFDTNGDPEIINGVQDSLFFVAGTKGGTHSAPVIAAFETDMDNDPAGALELIWSYVASENDFNYEHEVPVAITTSGATVALVSKITGTGNGTDIVVRLFDATDGELIIGPLFYTSSGDHEDMPVGVALDAGAIIVGGHGWNSSSGAQEMMALAFSSSGTLYGPTFITTPGSGRTFGATCFTAGANSQYNGPIAGSPGAVVFAVAGKMWNPSSPADEDWLVDTFRLSSLVPTALWDDPGTGMSTTLFADLPLAMCLAPVGVDYTCNGEPDVVFQRLWVSGGRTPVAGGPIEMTVVQFKAETDGGEIEWFDHFQLSDSVGQLDVRAGNCISVAVSDEAFLTRIYVGGHCDRPESGGSDSDFLLVKYSPQPTSPQPGLEKPPLWHTLYNTGIRNQVARGSISIRLADIVLPNPQPPYCDLDWVNRVVLITGLERLGTTDYFRTACYQDSNN